MKKALAWAIVVAVALAIPVGSTTWLVIEEGWNDGTQAILMWAGVVAVIGAVAWAMEQL